MLDDIFTLAWKERKTLFRYKGNRSRFLILLLSPLFLCTFFPWQYGPEWLAEIPPLILTTIVAVMLVGVMVPESFAGERERHTLETLLASRLPDRAIFFGKLVTPVALAWGVGLLSQVLSLVVINLTHWQGQFMFFTLPIALGSLLLSLLMALLTAGLGVFVSLRAATVQQAAQILMAIVLVPPMLLQVVPLVFRDQIGPFIETVDGPLLLTIIVAALAAVDLVVLLAAMARFQRSRLILS
jgi:ABC-2 type transport system permease protein